MLPSPTPVREWHNVGRECFESDIAPLYQPAVLRGFVEHWPAVREGLRSNDTLFNYLKGYATQQPVRLFLGAPEIHGRYFYTEDMRSFNFEELEGPFAAALAQFQGLIGAPDAPSIYMGATSIPSVLPGFEKDNHLEVIGDEVLPNIWIGGAATITTHFDTSDNIACAVAGKRRFTLFPPEQISNLYIGPLDHTPAGQPVSMVSVSNPDLSRYPRFAQALEQAQVAELAPGDALYIPPLWWHNVDSFAPLNVLVNYWWEPLTATTGSPFDSLIHSILAVSHLPLKQRQAWRAFFDHYVFGEAAPAEHLAPEHRGILGELTPEMAEEIKTYLKHGLQAGLPPEK